ncbi:MAG: hypothetical protein IJE08_08990, partial [Clostridia bacterium]|nr:hypothetical protein [Clostridia bacterium]
AEFLQFILDRKDIPRNIKNMYPKSIFNLSYHQGFQVGALGIHPNSLYFPATPLDTPEPTANLKLATHAVLATMSSKLLIVFAITF